MSSRKPTAFPEWFRMLICGGPWVLLLVLAIGLALGTAIHPIAIFLVAGLCSRTLPCVTGIVTKGYGPVVVVVPKQISPSEIEKLRDAS